MRTISAAQAALIACGAMGQSVRVSIKDSGGTFRDLTTYPGINMLDKVTWQDGNDSPGATATVTLVREVDNLSLAPLNEVSALNLAFTPGGTYAPLLAVAREIKIETSTDPMDAAAPANWMTVFHGYVDKVDPGQGEQVTLECRDLSARVMDTFIEVERVYAIGSHSSAPIGCRIWTPETVLASGEFVIPTDGKRKDAMYFYEVTSIGSAPHATGTKEPAWPTGVGATCQSPSPNTGDITFTRRSAIDPSVGYPVEDVMQEILDDNGLSSITLAVSSSPNPIDWDIRAYIQQREPVLEALRNLAIQIGWDVRYKWDSGSSTFKLTLFEPDRATATSLQTFTHAQIDQISGLAVDIADIRTAARLYYPDSNDTWPDGALKRKYVEAVDSAAEALYGHRWMEIQEDYASNIDTSTEAQAMVDACVSDLANPGVEMEARLVHGFPWVELGDLYTFQAQTEPDINRYFTSDQDLAVVGWTCEAMDGHLRTTLRCRGQPTLGKRRWFQREVRPSLGKRPHRETVFTDPGGITVTATNVVGGTAIIVSRESSIENRSLEYEYHLSESSGFTPSDSTLKGVSQGTQLTLADLVPERTYYAAVVPRYRNADKLLRTEKSKETQFDAGTANVQHLDPYVSSGLFPYNGAFEHQTRGATASYPPDRWNMASGTWGTQAVAGTDGNGGRSIVLDDVAGATEVKSDFFPVPNGAGVSNYYNIEGSYKTTGANAGVVSFQVVVYFYKDSAGTASSTASETHTITTASSGAWVLLAVEQKAVPSDANFIAIGLKKSASASDWQIEIGECWYFRVNIRQDRFIPLTYNTGWGDYGGGTYEEGEYRRDSFNSVELRGLVKRSSGSASVIATLPSGYRPAQQHVFPAESNGAARIDVKANGDIELTGGDPTNYVSLGGIRFSLD